MDVLIMLVCLNYFDLFSTLWQIQCAFLVLKLPILIKYYTMPLFPAKKEARENPQRIARSAPRVEQDSYVNSESAEGQGRALVAPVNKRQIGRAHV